MAGLSVSVLVMRRRGRPSIATAAERAEVERLLAEGVPIRAVAVQVFGDARYRGRVERILRRRGGLASGSSDDSATGPAEALASDPAPSRAVLERLLARLETPGVESSPRELVRLLELWRRLLTLEMLGRAKALTVGSALDACPSDEPTRTDGPPSEGGVAAGPDATTIVGAALAAWLARANAGELLPSLTELRAAMEVERRLLALGAFERANAVPSPE